MEGGGKKGEEKEGREGQRHSHSMPTVRQLERHRVAAKSPTCVRL